MSITAPKQCVCDRERMFVCIFLYIAICAHIHTHLDTNIRQQILDIQEDACASLHPHLFHSFILRHADTFRCQSV